MHIELIIPHPFSLLNSEVGDTKKSVENYKCRKDGRCYTLPVPEAMVTLLICLSGNYLHP